jgi:phage/plasmid-associated DNA primase
VDDLSYGFWRRVRLVPFTRTFIGNQDKHLAAKLVRELPGILAWAVRGCLAWQSEGLGAPASVRAATEQYRNESDPLSQFIDDCCVVNPNTQCGATEIYLAYQRWASQQGMSERERLSATSFGTKMGARFAKKRSGKGNVYVGLGLRSDREQDGHDPTRVQGSVQGSESSAGLIEVSPPEKSLTRENPEVPYTTLHPTQAVACHCGDEIDSFAADGSPRCWKHREVEARL